MTESLPLTYLIVLTVLLGISTIVILRQVLKTRSTEMTLRDLQRRLGKDPGTAAEYYELGSILLTKKLYSQAIAQMQKALKAKDLEAGVPTAMIYNALGYSYAAQEQYDLAIRQYKEALEQAPDYVIALNNLGFAYERKQLAGPALETYEQALKTDPNNKTAMKRAEKLRKVMP
jgi:tetratricopeptide (TPR) repeat protein